MKFISDPGLSCDSVTFPHSGKNKNTCLTNIESESILSLNMILTLTKTKSSWLANLLRCFFQILYIFRHSNSYSSVDVHSLQQLPEGLYAGRCPVSSSAASNSVTSPTVGYNIIPSSISATVIAPDCLLYQSCTTLTPQKDIFLHLTLCQTFLSLSLYFSHSTALF